MIARSIQILIIQTLLVLFAGHCSALAQQLDASVDLYGPDPLLYNGKYYTFFLPQGITGTPFLIENGFGKGSVTLKGVTYQDLELNYDLYNQQLVFRYVNEIGSLNMIVVSDAWLEKFTINQMKFRAVSLSDTTVKFYREYGSGPAYILAFNRKDKVIDSRLGISTYKFIRAKTQHYLFLHNNMLKYSGKKEFISYFNEDNQTVIKKFIRQNKIRLRKASDRQIDQLIGFCNTLSQ